MDRCAGLLLHGQNRTGEVLRCLDACKDGLKHLSMTPPSEACREVAEVPLGYGMLYQQSIELPDANGLAPDMRGIASNAHSGRCKVQINWTPVTNFNCKFVPVGKPETQCINYDLCVSRLAL